MSQLEVTTEGPLGVITLNRPEAINALSREMIDGIAMALHRWVEDENVTVVLFEGRGSRGFCAGGDVRAMRQLALSGGQTEADAYFAAEYAMNLQIATYAKPIVAIGHGAVMGGGIGILGHAHYRFSAAESRFAMPEAAIGFVCDVGVNAILAEATEARALAFLMSGLAVNMGDALELGLCDAAIVAGKIEAVRRGIVTAAAHADPEAALVRLMEAEGVRPSGAVLCAQADGLVAEFSGATAADIVAAVAAQAAREQGLERLSDALASRSPTSQEAIVQSHRAARARPDIESVLALDLRLASFMARQPDFAEGVRAVLVDKDQKPIWRPRELKDVNRQAIKAVIAG
ncbi:MAG: enoyl-CoA hydratase/isomerase family protein [Devosia sp.]|nr:enoyl-CoA hydratase/isomerase family protein [Devosia sp.]